MTPTQQLKTMDQAERTQESDQEVEPKERPSKERRG